MEGFSENYCPVCENQMKENETIIFCQECGWNMNKKEPDVKPRPSQQG